MNFKNNCLFSAALRLLFSKIGELLILNSIAHEARDDAIICAINTSNRPFPDNSFNARRDSVEKRSNSFEGFRREAIVKSTLQHFPGSPSSLPISQPSMLHYITRVLYTINSTVMRDFYDNPNKANFAQARENVLITCSYSVKLNSTIIRRKM